MALHLIKQRDSFPFIYLLIYVAIHLFMQLSSRPEYQVPNGKVTGEVKQSRRNPPESNFIHCLSLCLEGLKKVVENDSCSWPTANFQTRTYRIKIRTTITKLQTKK